MKYAKLSILFLLSISFSAMHAQQFTEFGEFIRLSQESDNTYEMKLITEDIEAVKPLTTKININQYHKDPTGQSIKPVPYSLDAEAIELNTLAEYYLMAEEPDSSIKYSEMVLERSSDYSPALSMIGMAYDMKQDSIKAGIYYQKAVKLNYIDYMAHWMLAKYYNKMNLHDSAVWHISAAWILNRNHSQIQKELGSIYSDAGLEFKNWEFVPQYEIVPEDSTVIVSYKEEWMGYAICQAVWEYESSYQQQQLLAGKMNPMYQERECLACLLESMKHYSKKTKKDESLTAFKAALKNNYSYEFLVFERILTDDPMIAYRLSEAKLQNMVNYLINIRGGKLI